MSDQNSESKVDKHDSSMIANALRDIAASSKETGERIAKQEVNYEHLTDSITSLANTSKENFAEVTKSHKDLNENMNNLTLLVSETIMSNKALEDKTIGQIDKVTEKVNRIESDVASMHEQICVLEVKTAKEEGKEEAKQSMRDFWQKNWFKLIMLFIVSIPVIHFLYGKIKPITGG